MASGNAPCGCEVEAYTVQDYGAYYLEDVEIKFCETHKANRDVSTKSESVTGFF